MKMSLTLRLLLAAFVAGGGCTDSLSGNSPSAPPAAPSNFAGLLQNGGTEIDLSWTSGSGGGSGFRLEVNTSPFGTPPYLDVIYLAAGSSSTVYLTQPNTTYYLRLYAITATSQSDPSSVITLTTPNFPAPPFYFTALATGPNSIDVHWLNGAGVNGNTVQRSPDGTIWTTIFNNATAPGVVGVTDSTGLAANTVYFYRGYASSALGTSGPTPLASTRTQTTPGGITTVTTGAPLSASEDIGIHSSLTFAGGANQVIASYDHTLSNLALTTGGFPGPYFTQTIDGFLGSGYYGTTVAADGSSHVHIAAHYFAGNSLRFVTNETGAYVASTIDSSGSVGRAPILRVAPDQTLHIIYRVENAGTGDGWLRLASRANAVGSPWIFDTFLGYEPVLGPHSFVIDGAGNLHVIYSRQRSGVYDLMHVERIGGIWTFGLIAQSGQPDMSSIAVGAGNSLHVAYKDESTGALMYATNTTGAWTVEEVHRHTTGNLGRHNSVLYFPTASGDIHISYYDSVFGNLWYAGRSGIGGAWNRRLVDSVGDVGRYTSIASDGTVIYVSYYDAGNGKLKILQNPQN
jgi:hypothetical protein